MDWTLSTVSWGFDSVDKTSASYAVFIGLFILVASLLLSRSRQRLWSYIIVWSVYPLLSLWLAFFLGRDIFDALNLLSMATFLGGVGLFCACSYYAWPHYKKFASVFAFCAVCLTAVGIDAFIVEPTWLEVRHEKITSNKVQKPLRIAVISDLQTDRVGNFERTVLKQAMDAQPDMVLLPGDYIQAYHEEFDEQVVKLRACLKDSKVSAPLGVFATQGDSERREWVSIFKDLPVTTFPKSETIAVGRNNDHANPEVMVTGLTLRDSWRLSYQIPQTKNFHIVVAHRPDYMLKAREGDLLIAGHTHGGQVQLPIYGPLLTFSDAPREWCGGCCITNEEGRTFVITRGVGMEREHAPRLRFFCRPEIVIIDVVPGAISSASPSESRI